MSARLPAPVALAWWLIGKPVKVTRKRRAAAKVTARHEARTTELLERQAERLGITVNESVAAVEPVQVVSGERAEAVRSWLYRHRRDAVAPVAVAAALAAVRVFVHWMADGWTWVAVAGVLLPLAGIAAVSVWWVTQIGSAGRRVAAVAVTVLALAWVASPARLPLPVWPHALWLMPDMPLTAWGSRWLLLAAATALAVAVRWGRFQPRKAAAAPEVGPVEIWAAEIGCEKGKLEGSRLTGFEWISDVTWQATFAGVRGKQGTDELRDARREIAGIYGISPDWIEVQGQDDYSLPRMLVTRKATLRKSQPYRPGSVDLKTGKAEMATYPDGSRACIQSHSPGRGVKHNWFAGGTGSGKTSAVCGYLGRMMSSGIAVLDLVDLGETSLPAWAPVAFRFGTTVPDARMALKRANAVMDARKAWMREAVWTDRDGGEHTGISTIEPSEEWPIYELVLEEFPEAHGDSEVIRLADRIGRKGRKFAVKITVITQPADLKGAFGNAEALRMNIQRGGNVYGLSNESGAGKMVFGGSVKVDLGAIPLDQPGIGYLVGPANYRDVMCRSDYIEDKDSIRPHDVMSSFQVAALARPATLNPVDLAAIEAVEAEEAERLERVARGEVPADTSGSGLTRDDVEHAARKAVEAAGGQPVRLAAVAGVLAPQGLDELARKRHDDTVRKHLSELVKDPASAVVKPKRSDGSDEWGMYVVA